MSNQYYYLVSGLHEIVPDEPKLSVSRLKFREECREQVHPDDFKLIKKLFYPDDNANLYNILLKTGKEFKDSGNYAEEALEEEIRTPETLPDYMVEFIELYRNKQFVKPDISVENQLQHLFYGSLCSDENRFIRTWYRFDRNLKNILVGLNARKYEFSFENEIIGDNFCSERIRTSGEHYFNLSKELDYIESITNLFDHDDIVEMEKGIDHVKWDYLDELTTFDYFSIEAIMSFILKLGIAERWLKLDKKAGNEFFNRINLDLQNSYEFPKEFALTGKKAA